MTDTLYNVVTAFFYDLPEAKRGAQVKRNQMQELCSVAAVCECPVQSKAGHAESPHIQIYHVFLPEAKVPGGKPRHNCDMLHMPLQSW